MTFLLDCALRTSVVISLALAALPLMRRQSAALRHSVLAAAIVCSLAVPVLAFVGYPPLPTARQESHSADPEERTIIYAVFGANVSLIGTLRPTMT